MAGKMRGATDKELLGRLLRKSMEEISAECRRDPASRSACIKHRELLFQRLLHFGHIRLADIKQAAAKPGHRCAVGKAPVKAIVPV